jgi:hypothetical protein
VTTELDLAGRRAQLLEQRDRGRSAIVRGTALLVLAPVMVVLMLGLLLAFDSMWPVLGAIGYVLIGGGWGLASIVVGGAQLSGARKGLRELDDPLPKARLLK